MTRSDRYVETSATCEVFTVSTIDYVDLSENSTEYTDFGTTSISIIQYLKGGSLFNLSLPDIYFTGTTYISWVDSWEGYNVIDCGPGCGRMAVIQVAEKTNDTWLYTCQSTVHEVKGAALTEEKLGDKVSLVAATSLSQGLDGTSIESLSRGTEGETTQILGISYNIYTSG